MQKRSLNREVRKKNLLKITIENQAILKRLQDRQSNYDVNKWESEFKGREKILRKMCEFPYCLDARTNQTMTAGFQEDESVRMNNLPRIGTAFD